MDRKKRLGQITLSDERQIRRCWYEDKTLQQAAEITGIRKNYIEQVYTALNDISEHEQHLMRQLIQAGMPKDQALAKFKVRGGHGLCRNDKQSRRAG